jgi:spoIIIJ-associated protein
MENREENREIEKKLEEIVSEHVSKMGFQSEVSVKKSDEDGRETFVCDLKTDESNFLIGQYGVNLQSLQHIARVVVRKKIEDKINFVLDVNSYRQEKNDSVVKMAKSFAEQALSEKRAIVMRPMSSYERRIVHLELSKDERIKTESIGEGEDRRVVIKPIDIA